MLISKKTGPAFVSLVLSICCVTLAVMPAVTGRTGDGLQTVSASEGRRFETSAGTGGGITFSADNFYADDMFQTDQTRSQVDPSTGQTKNAYYIGSKPFSLVLRNYNTEGVINQNNSTLAGNYSSRDVSDAMSAAVRNIADITDSSLDDSWLMLSQRSYGAESNWTLGGSIYSCTNLIQKLNEDYVYGTGPDSVDPAERTMLKSAFVTGDDDYNAGRPNIAYVRLYDDQMASIGTSGVSRPSDSENALLWYNDASGKSKTRFFPLSLSEVNMISRGYRMTSSGMVASGTDVQREYGISLLRAVFANESDYSVAQYPTRSLHYVSADSVGAFSVENTVSKVGTEIASNIRTTVKLPIVPAANLDLGRVVICREAKESAGRLSPEGAGSGEGSSLKPYDPKAIHISGGTKFVVPVTEDAACYRAMKNFTVSGLDGKTLDNAYAGRTYTVDYSGAGTGEGYYISAIIYDDNSGTGENKILYEGRLKAVGSQSSGTAEITLPDLGDSFREGKHYRLALFEEKVSDDAYGTNVASRAAVSDFTPDNPVELDSCRLTLNTDGTYDGMDYYRYTGQTIKPSYALTYQGGELDEGDEYICSCEPAVIRDRGVYTLTFSAKGDYFVGNRKKKIYVLGDMSDLSTARGWDGTQLLKTGETAEIPLYEQYGSNERRRIPAEAYSVIVDYDWGKENGSVATCTGDVGHFLFGTKQVRFTAKRDISDSKITAAIRPGESTVYTGRSLTPAIEVLRDGKPLEKSDYSVSYGVNKTVSDGISCTVSGAGVYGGSRKVTASMMPASVRAATVKNESEIRQPVVYAGSPVTRPDPVLGLDGGIFAKTALEKNVDFTVSYEDNNAPGTGKMIISGKGNFTGRMEIPFEIKDSPAAKVTVAADGKASIDAAEEPMSASVLAALVANEKITEFALAENSPHYTVRSGLLLDASGKNLLAIPGGKTITGSADVAKILADARVSSIPLSAGRVEVSVPEDKSVSISAAGEIPRPSVEPVMINGCRLMAGSDYTVEYAADPVSMRGSVTVRGIGSFSGSITKSYSLAPTKQIIVPAVSGNGIGQEQTALAVDAEDMTRVVTDSAKKLIAAQNIDLEKENVQAQLTVTGTVSEGEKASLKTKAKAFGFEDIADMVCVKETVTSGGGTYDITELSDLVTLRFTVPASMQKEGRHFIVIRESDGEVVCSDTTENTMSVKTYRMGAYAIAYRDEAEKSGQKKDEGTESGQKDDDKSGGDGKTDVEDEKKPADSGTSSEKSAGEEKPAVSESGSKSGAKDSTSSGKKKPAKSGKKSAGKSTAVKKTRAKSASAKSPKTKSVSCKAKKKAFVIRAGHVSGTITGYRVAYRKKGTEKWKLKTVRVKKSGKLKKKIKVRKKGTYQVKVQTFRKVKKKTYYSAFSKVRKVRVKK